MKTKNYRLLATLASIFTFLGMMAQPAQKLVTISVTPEGTRSASEIEKVADSYIFPVGEKVKFNISVSSSNIPLDNISISYSIMADKMPARKSETITLENGKATVDGGTMSVSGFLRCTATTEVDGVKYTGTCAVGFAPNKIKPTVTEPADFDKFWSDALKSLSKVPLDSKLTLLPERCNDKVNVYEVKIASVRPMYGILCIPKSEGKHPAVLRVPGAGVHKIGGYFPPAENDGYITLDLGIHSIPLTADAEFYKALSTGTLRDYPSINIDNPQNYYYRNVYLGCIRAVEFLKSLPEHDGKNIFVVGGSQGGALSIATAALSPDVTGIMTFFPALSDQEAYLKGRAGGWHHYFYFHKNDSQIDRAVKTVRYYDTVNFARRVKVPVYMSFGFNDLTCAPTSTYAAWNSISSEQRKLLIVPETGHWYYPHQWSTGWKWLQQFRK